MHKIVLSARPVTGLSDAQLLLSDGQCVDISMLSKDQPITITPDYSIRYCTGWYDIDTHTNYPCGQNEVAGDRHETCYTCRKKTDFNPAFYNSATISKKQAAYNSKPHTVYVAYFGDGLAKAGIMSDSRGLDRLYEQGALLYAIIEQCPNATMAHNIEERLIKRGLKNSITKSQKQRVLQNGFNEHKERTNFAQLLSDMKLSASIQTNMPTFLFGQALPTAIENIGHNQISGIVHGVIGRYLILHNSGYFYGTWLNDIFGYRVKIDNQIIPIVHAPIQASLF